MDFSNLPLFRGASAADVAAAQALAARKDYLVGDSLFTPSAPPRAIYVIEIGSVALVPHDKDNAVATLGSGQVVGEGAFFGGGEHPYTAVAREITHAFAIPNDELQRLLDERPAFALIVYRNAARRFAEICRRMALLLDHPYL